VASSSPAPSATAQAVTIMTQTRVLPDRETDFAAWQQHVSDAISRFPGFVDQQVIPPAPPAQVDWVILQKFDSIAQAQAWLKSPERQRLVAEGQPMFVGHDDIHLITGDQAARPPETISAIISMTLKPGQEEAYRVWNQKITAAEAQFPGFLGHKLEPPIPGVQNDWVSVLTFDNEAHLNAWMNSPERQALLQESAPFTAEQHTRTVRSGFEQWFQVPGGAALPPVWKQNMLTLLGLYPTVFLFGFFLGTPIFTHYLGMPFWLSLFFSNMASVLILTVVIPWLSRRFGWWLHPAGDTQRINLIGIVALVVLYALLVLAFSLFPPALIR
jgi:antibiotic biosynthesis monooxygenase (ABM) superfamily enzyme